MLTEYRLKYCKKVSVFAETDEYPVKSVMDKAFGWAISFLKCQKPITKGYKWRR